MGTVPRKRDRNVDQDSGEPGNLSKRRRHLDHRAQKLSQLYENLAADSDDVRLEAVKEFLVIFSTANKPMMKDVKSALSRLIQGLCSQRQAARVGFSLTLTELLRQVFRLEKEHLNLDAASVIEMIEQLTKVHGNVSGRERRDHIIGKLFAYKAVMQSSIVVEPTVSSECWNLLMDHVCKMACEVPWLREECGMVLVEAVQSLNAQSKFRKCVQDILRHLQTHKLVYTPQGVGIWLTAQANYKDALPEGVWHKNDPLSKKERLRLAKILKENFHDDSEKDCDNVTKTAGGNPNPSFAWDMVLSEVLQRDKDNSTEKEKREFPHLWIDIVDDNLFSSNSSHERKAWGFKLLSKMIKRAPKWAIPALLSPNLVRTLVNQSKDQARFLHAAALSALRTVQDKAQQEPGLSSALFTALYTRYSSVGSDRHMIISTLEQILLAADSENMRKIVRHLGSVILRPGSEDSHIADRRRQVIADLLLNTVKHYKLYNELDESFVEMDSWLRNTLEILIENAYFVPNQSAKTRKVPLPPLSDLSRAVFQERLSSCLARLFNADIRSRCAIATAVLDIIRMRSRSVESLDLILKAEQTVLDTIETAFQTLNALSSQKSGKSKMAAEGFILLYSVTLLQVYNGEADAVMMLTDLDGAYQEMFSKDKDSADVVGQFVEIILSFLGNPRTLFHKIGEEVFSMFSHQIRPEGLQSLVAVLDAEESLEGQQALFNSANDAVDESLSSDDSESDSDIQMIDGKARDSESDASDASDSDGAGGSKSGKSSDAEEDSEDDAELTEFNNLLALTLQTSKLKTNNNNNNNSGPQESSSDESDMDDDQMMALDPHLSEMFQKRSKRMSTKKQRKKAKQNVVQFKSRVLDLVAAYTSKQYSNPLVFELILPVLRRTRAQASEQIAEKAGKVLKALFNTRTNHKASLPRPDDVESVWELLKGIHQEAKMGDGARLHASMCSAASLYIAKVLVGLQKAHYSRIVDIYGETQKEWFLDKASSLPPVMFTQFQNWSQERRKQGKQGH